MRQRSRVLWLKDVDRNTKFFHARAFSRRRKNKISGLRDEYGCWRDDPEELKGIMTRYFSRLFASSSEIDMAEVLEAIEPVVSQADNEVLLRPFQKDEIRDAVFQMNPDKAPGPDGFNPAFRNLGT